MRQATATQLLARAFDAAGLAPQPVELIGLGESGDVVARLNGLYLKIARIGPTDRVDELGRETTALKWLAGRITVPDVVWSGDVEGGRVLLTTALEGMPVSHASPQDATAALTASLHALAALHRLAGEDCPIDARLGPKLALAAARVAQGLVDADDFDNEPAGWTAERALAEVRATAPGNERLVVTHGDASLPNFIWSPGGDVGLIDLGRFGLADPYQDLALFLRSAKRNHPHVDTQALVLEHYPIATLDADRCAFYRLLDELF